MREAHTRFTRRLEMAKTRYPVIDGDACADCGACVGFCPHGVFERDGDRRPLIKAPRNCVEFCPGCAKICPAEATAYYGDDDR